MISTLSRTVAHRGKLLDELPYECVVHRDLRDPVELMAGCDVAVTAGGMTSLELATLGVPVVILPSSPMEAGVARVLAQQADARVVDADSNDWEGKLVMTLQAIWVRRGRAARSSVLDAGGAERVVRVMESLSEGAGYA
jgi:spore coat polysaccharide biosynthesis predicted glycosyltransferase SpsG